MTRARIALFLSLFGALSCGRLQAGPIPLAPGPVPSAGESLLTSFTSPGSGVNVDWEVIPTSLTAAFAPGAYLYLYQLENTAANSQLDVFTVSLPAGAAANVITSGFLANDNLDVDSVLFHPGHNAGNFPILATEADPFPLHSIAGGVASIDTVDDTVTWSFNGVNQPIPVGMQSDTMYFISPIPPIYGFGEVLDHSDPSPWSSRAVNGQPVPVPASIPAPEPTSLALMALGLASLGLLRKRRRA